MRQLIHFSLAIAFVIAATTDADAFQKKPNIVFIMADDLGPGWVDYDDSNAEINTPNLQRLAENGMVFTKAYAAATVCSPCLLYTSPSPRDATLSRMPSSA